MIFKAAGSLALTQWSPPGAFTSIPVASGAMTSAAFAARA
jgi:hypothetical protein